MKYLILLSAIVPSIAFAQDISPSSPMPMMQNMIGNLAGELATTSAKLTDAQNHIKSLEQEVKDKQPQDKPQKEAK